MEKKQNKPCTSTGLKPHAGGAQPRAKVLRTWITMPWTEGLASCPFPKPETHRIRGLVVIWLR